MVFFYIQFLYKEAVQYSRWSRLSGFKSHSTPTSLVISNKFLNSLCFIFCCVKWG